MIGERCENALLGHTPSVTPILPLPTHMTVHLIHNEHKMSYGTVADSVAMQEHGYADDAWVSLEQRQKAIDTNECWSLQWYPQTPVGFYILSAADLDALLSAASEMQQNT